MPAEAGRCAARDRAPAFGLGGALRALEHELLESSAGLVIEVARKEVDPTLGGDAMCARRRHAGAPARSMHSRSLRSAR